MNWHLNRSLAPYNTFGINCIADRFLEIQTLEDLEGLDLKEGIPFILGGGSNLLLPDKLNTSVIQNRIGGIEEIDANDREVTLRIGGGVNWHKMVTFCVENQLGGIENLALIPGTVGAAPIQNIGAYGVELKNVFQRLRAISLESGEQLIFEKDDCQFGYRDSIFKRELRSKILIFEIEIKLNRARFHDVNTTYRSLQDDLNSRGLEHPGINDVYNAVIDIRQSKLPDPAVIGNSGSFFKNVVVTPDKLETLKSKFDNLAYYDNGDGNFKIPTGWLIDRCGWKGKSLGDAGCYKNQALVLVNLGHATSKDIRSLALAIMDDVYDKFEIEITPEVNIISPEGRYVSEDLRQADF